MNFEYIYLIPIGLYLSASLISYLGKKYIYFVLVALLTTLATIISFLLGLTFKVVIIPLLIILLLNLYRIEKQGGDDK